MMVSNAKEPQISADILFFSEVKSLRHTGTEPVPDPFRYRYPENCPMDSGIRRNDENKSTGMITQRQVHVETDSGEQQNAPHGSCHQHGIHHRRRTHILGDTGQRVILVADAIDNSFDGRIEHFRQGYQ